LTQYETTIITDTDSDSNISKRNTLKFVDQALTINKIKNTTKNTGDSYTLPRTVTATLVNKTTKDFAVTWNKVARTKVPGLYRYINNVMVSDTLIEAMPIIVQMVTYGNNCR